ncbi:AAA family ATPase [Neobacillus sp. OS1-33]|uniref:AAA family ATPase n=1 Tax=Neobacillus sp. OS1-33 TaxID=3070683 RepID=UPI0027DFCFA2|nr:AAA family ATPase [Neobacillus sp. OS1-33]WML26307.1 AAA family ATPase [Neobacillus sp. OS1-33]
MRIRRIGVDSVLHYNSFNLDFNEGNGLHVLYGNNEAGKSTLLNLMLDLLFGGQLIGHSRDYYDTRSQLDGILENFNSSPVTIQRKKNRNRLVLSSASSLSEEDLVSFISGYDRDRFMLLFGFDHDRLREGGQRLLESEGNAGVSLFEAGGGIQFLQNLMAQLGNRSSELLDPSFRKSSVKKLNKAWTAYNNAKSSVDKDSLSGDLWLRNRNEILVLSRQVEGMKEELQGKQREEAKLKRINRVRTMITELQSIRRNLQDYTGAIVLTDELDQMIPTLIKNHQDALKDLNRLKSDQEKQSGILQSIQLDAPALDHAEEIEKLTEGLQQYVTRTTEELPGLEEKILIRGGDAINLLKSIAPNISLNEVEQLRIPYADEINIESLADQCKRLRLDIEREQENYDKLVFKQEKVKQDLQELGSSKDMANLQQRVKEFREQGNLEESCTTIEMEFQKKKQELNQLLQGQTLWNGLLEKINELKIPLRETMEQYHQLWETTKQNQNECDRDLNTKKNQLTEFNNQLEQLELSGYVPVETDLDAARNRRNAGWSLVKQAWQQGLPETSEKVQEYAGNGILADEYEKSVNEADHLADLMRRDSERSAKRALLLLQKAQTERDIDELLGKKERLENKFQDIEAKWKQEWEPCGIVPKTPAEMKDWANTFYSPLVNGYNELQSKQFQLAQLKEKVSSCIATLNKELHEIQIQPPLNSELKLLLDYCDTLIAVNNERESDQKSFNNQMKENQMNLEENNNKLSRIKEQLNGFEAEWDELRQKYSSLPQKVDTATAYVRELKNLFDCVKEVNDLQSTITSCQQACQLFEKQAADLAEQLKDPFTCSVDVWVRSVRERLQSARDADNRFEQIQSSISDLEMDIQKATGVMNEYEVELQQLKEKYDCKDIADLEVLIKRSAASKELDKSYKAQERSIIQAGDGLSIGQLEAELSELDNPDDLSIRVPQLEEEITGLQNNLEDEKERLNKMQFDFDQLDGSKDAAAFNAQLVEESIEEVDRYWNEYLQVELARRLLQRTIDEFREKNQSTILDMAGEIFRRFTSGKYMELRVDYDDNTPFIEAVHSDGTKRRVHQMSDGTRDQLFLSLRLAFVQQHLDSSDPLPVIIDDVFVNFDDERTKAALEVLHELSEKTQILYFTHHQSVVNMTEKMKASGRVHVYDLSKTSGVLSLS